MTIQTRDDIRNVAIVAHVDHGKTTLVDAMLWQSGAFRDNQSVNERVMDSGDLEREKGITILAKNTAVLHNGVKINIIDTPGHADFGGEVERGLTMVDGVLLLVDASEGPLPQTRFVLRKALEARLPVVLVVNKVDRPDARIDEVVHEVEELFLDLDADEQQIDFPILFSNARAGWAATEQGVGGTDLEPLFQAILDRIPAPHYDVGRAAPGHRVQPRRLPVPGPAGRVPCPQRHPDQGGHRGVVQARRDHRADQDHRSLHHRRARPGRVRLGRARGDRRRRRHGGDHHRRDVGRCRRPPPAPGHHRGRAQPRHDHRDQHLAAGRDRREEADRPTGPRSPRVRAHRQRVAAGNPTERPDTWEVQGRGELQLAVLVETMRREGFELTVGKPQVVTREIDGKLHEPMERVAIDVPDDYLGVVILSTFGYSFERIGQTIICSRCHD